MHQVGCWRLIISFLPKPINRRTFSRELFKIAGLFQDRLVQRALTASRADGRAANLQLAKLAARLLKWLDSKAAKRLDWGRISILRAPEVTQNAVWTNELIRILEALIAEAAALPDSLQSVPMGIADSLTKQLRGNLRNARTEVSLWAINAQQTTPYKKRDDSWNALKAGLTDLHGGALKAAEIDRPKKGGRANSELHLAIVDLDKLVYRFRGRYLERGDISKREYTGRPETADDRFVVGFVDLVLATIPPCIKNQKPFIFRHLAALDALKERCEDRRRAQ